jgi:hypothetical protein
VSRFVHEFGDAGKPVEKTCCDKGSAAERASRESCFGGVETPPFHPRFARFDFGTAEAVP